MHITILFIFLMILMKNNLFNKSQMKKYADNKAFHLTVQKHDFLKTHAEKIKNPPKYLKTIKEILEIDARLNKDEKVSRG